MPKPVIKWTFPRIKRHKFNGHSVKITWRAPRPTQEDIREAKTKKLFVYGQANVDRPRKMFISMDPEMHTNAEDFHSTLLHESAHHAFPQIDEESIRDFERDFTGLLQRLGMKFDLPHA